MASLSEVLTLCRLMWKDESVRVYEPSECYRLAKDALNVLDTVIEASDLKEVYTTLGMVRDIVPRLVKTSSPEATEIKVILIKKAKTLLSIFLDYRGSPLADSAATAWFMALHFAKAEEDLAQFYGHGDSLNSALSYDCQPSASHIGGYVDDWFNSHIMLLELISERFSSCKIPLGLLCRVCTRPYRLPQTRQTCYRLIAAGFVSMGRPCDIHGRLQNMFRLDNPETYAILKELDGTGPHLLLDALASQESLHGTCLHLIFTATQSNLYSKLVRDKLLELVLKDPRVKALDAITKNPIDGSNTDLPTFIDTFMLDCMQSGNTEDLILLRYAFDMIPMSMLVDRIRPNSFTQCPPIWIWRIEDYNHAKDGEEACRDLRHLLEHVIENDIFDYSAGSSQENPILRPYAPSAVAKVCEFMIDIKVGAKDLLAFKTHFRMLHSDLLLLFIRLRSYRSARRLWELAEEKAGKILGSNSCHFRGLCAHFVMLTQVSGSLLARIPDALILNIVAFLFPDQLEVTETHL